MTYLRSTTLELFLCVALFVPEQVSHSLSINNEQKESYNCSFLVTIMILILMMIKQTVE